MVVGEPKVQNDTTYNRVNKNISILDISTVATVGAMTASALPSLKPVAPVATPKTKPTPTASTAPAGTPKGPSSPTITADDLAMKTRSQIRDLAKAKGLKPGGDTAHPDYPRKFNDPVTGEERIRLDRGHVDPKTGKPYNNPKAAADHVHGYDEKGAKIKHAGDPHIPTKGE
jgi:hypothetical protein